MAFLVTKTRVKHQALYEKRTILKKITELVYKSWKFCQQADYGIVFKTNV